MRVVDTSAWIEWMLDSPTGAQIAKRMPARDEWVIPTIVQLELANWIKREGDEEMADRVIAFSEKCQVVDLDMKLALAAAEASARHKLATADAIVYATAEARDTDILTCDGHLDGLPKVILVPKRGV